MISLNGILVSEEKALFCPLDRAVSYGEGVFTTVMIVRGEMMWWNDHFKRLQKDMKALEISSPWDSQAIQRFIKELLLVHPEKALYGKVKIIITKGYNPSLDLRDTNGCTPQIIISCAGINDLSALHETGLRLKTSQENRPYPEIKSLNYLTSILENRKARKEGFDEVLFVGEDLIVRETSISNIFFLKGNRWLSPAKNVLPGITRAKVIPLIESLGYDFEFRDLGVSEIPEFQEAFTTGTTTKITPVVEIDSIEIGEGSPGKETQKIMKKFSEIYF